MLAVALNNSVYLWNGDNNKVSKLLENNQNISSINWNKGGELMSVGLDDGGV
jgi:cell division cycle protein 20 (cofactor of APC complex)